MLCLCYRVNNEKVKGDKDAYRKIDFDIPVNLARFCKMTGCEKFILVSSAGANSKSMNFYQRLKGETDEAVKEVWIENSSYHAAYHYYWEKEKNFDLEKILAKLVYDNSFVSYS